MWYFIYIWLDSSVPQATPRSSVADIQASNLIKIDKRFRVPISEAVFTNIKNNTTDEMLQVIQHLKFMSFSTAQGLVLLYLFITAKWVWINFD